MGKDVVHFRCHSCAHCCREVVCLPTPWDVRRINRMTGEDPFDFLEFLEPDELDGVDEDDPTWLEFGNTRYMMALEREEGRGCYFLDQKTNLCGIYEARPILCRLYPFKLLEDDDGTFQGFTLHEDVGCPKNTDGEMATGPLYDIYVQDDINQDDYIQMVNIFNSMNYKGKKPEDFVEMFMEGFTDWEPPQPVKEPKRGKKKKNKRKVKR